jgi:hypothetical protein
MKHHYNEVLRKLSNGLVVLTQHGQAVAVMAAPAYWDEVVEEREELLDVIAALKAELALARGDVQLEDIDPNTFIAEITGNAIPAQNPT